MAVFFELSNFKIYKLQLNWRLVEEFWEMRATHPKVAKFGKNTNLWYLNLEQTNIDIQSTNLKNCFLTIICKPKQRKKE